MLHAIRTHSVHMDRAMLLSSRKLPSSTTLQKCSSGCKMGDSYSAMLKGVIYICRSLDSELDTKVYRYTCVDICLKSLPYGYSFLFKDYSSRLVRYSIKTALRMAVFCLLPLFPVLVFSCRVSYMGESTTTTYYLFVYFSRLIEFNVQLLFYRNTYMYATYVLFEQKNPSNTE